MSIKAALRIVSSLYLSHKVIMGFSEHCSAVDRIKDDFRERKGSAPLFSAVAFACFVRAGSKKGAACLTLRQLWHTLPPLFYTFISCRSVYPAPYLSALFVFKHSLTCPSSEACHHLVYNCFKGLKRVLQTPTVVNLTWQPGIVQSLFLSVLHISVL